MFQIQSKSVWLSEMVILASFWICSIQLTYVIVPDVINGIFTVGSDESMIDYFL